jgi:FtsP/CotA-like multicopper oxidase with cupredoxin domain
MPHTSDELEQSGSAPLSRRRFLSRAGAVVPLALTAAGCVAETDSEGANEAGTGATQGPASNGTQTAAAIGDNGGHGECITAVDGVLAVTFRCAYADPPLQIPRRDPDGAELPPRELRNRAYDGRTPGPTLCVSAGDTIELTLINELPANPAGSVANTTNMHTHGLHISPMAPSDDVLLEIPPQLGARSRFDYLFNIWDKHPPGTHWYHPHKHGSTAEQVENGMAGALIVADYPGTLPPPMRGIAERVFVLQQLLQDADPPFDERSVQLGSNADSHLYLVNGAEIPVIRIDQGEVQRWRFVNAAVNANGYFNLAVVTTGEEPVDCTDPADTRCQPMHHIAMDGIYLPAMTRTRNTLLAPGNRADFLVKFDTPGRYWLYDLGHNRGGDFVLAAELRPHPVRAIVQVDPPDRGMLLPGDMPLPDPSPMDPGFLRPPAGDEITGYRELVFDTPGNPFRPMIDCKQFATNRLDHVMALGAVEEWTIINRSGGDHPFHIHVNPFWVIEKNGVPVDNPRWQDVVNVEGTVNSGLAGGGSIKFRSRFVRFSGDYVLHCHILPHEDLGMMQHIEVNVTAPLTGDPPYARAAGEQRPLCPVPE